MITANTITKDQWEIINNSLDDRGHPVEIQSVRTEAYDELVRLGIFGRGRREVGELTGLVRTVYILTPLGCRVEGCRENPGPRPWTLWGNWATPSGKFEEPTNKPYLVDVLGKG